MRSLTVLVALCMAVTCLTSPTLAEEGWIIHAPTASYNATTDIAKCERCHITNPFDGTQVLENPINASCLSIGCHSPYLADSLDHPTLITVTENSVFPSLSIPEPFWLDEDHRLNCATCHNPHPDEAEYRPYLLRYNSVEPPIFFCQECHGENDPFPSPHRQKILSAHSLPYTVAHDNHPGEGIELMDRTSAACSLECHPKDDVHSGFCIVGQREGCKGHYVGIIYEERATPDNPEMTPREALPLVVSLHEGKVGCLSCHSIYSKKKNLQTIAIDRSALCLVCHRK